MTIKHNTLRAGTVFAYKLTVDNGGAPCVHRGLLSLSICKPRIRVAANVGDWILGFGARSIEELRGRLIYVARVTEVVEDGNYYRSRDYLDRPDCIYTHDGSAYAYREGSRFHGPEDLEHDLGEPQKHARARNLLSDQFIYFGRKPGPSLEDIADIYEELPRDFLKNHERDVRTRLEAFILRVFTEFSMGAPGKPTHKPSRSRCERSEHGLELPEVVR